MICLPVQGDDSQALASGLSPIQADKPWYDYFIPPISVRTLPIVRYFVLKLAFSGKSAINRNMEKNSVFEQFLG